jgi:hypothetical protein
MQKENVGKNNLAGLEFTIGGDDARPTTELDIKASGLNGKDFIYHFPDAEGLGHRKGRILDAGNKIFILIYASDTASGLESKEGARFFNSFQVVSGPTPNKRLKRTRLSVS